jgi:hypothetical protein
VSPTAMLAPREALLGGDVVAHLEAQLLSARRLLQVVLEQGAGIRARDVDAVVRQAGKLQAEVEHRQLLDRERSRLLERAGLQLGLAPGAVTLAALSTLMEPSLAQHAAILSQELQGLLAELQREHAINRALMSQELQFLDHLMRLIDGEGDGYEAGGTRPAVKSGKLGVRRMLDLEA